MEQPQEETPEVREEEKEEVAEAEGAPELNGGPEHALPSSSYTGEEGAEQNPSLAAWALCCPAAHQSCRPWCQLSLRLLAGKQAGMVGDVDLVCKNQVRGVGNAHHCHCHCHYPSSAATRHPRPASSDNAGLHCTCDCCEQWECSAVGLVLIAVGRVAPHSD